MRKEPQGGFQAGAAFGAPLIARGPPRGAVQVLFLPVPSLPLLGARDLCRAELASFGLVLGPRGLPPRQGPRRFGLREGLRRSPGRSPAPRALESGSWVSLGLRRASPGDFTAWPRCVCVFGGAGSAVRPGGQRTAREGTRAGTQGEDGGLGPPGLQRTGEAKASLAGPARGLWLPSSPGRKRRRRLGLLPAVKGEAAAATTAGAPARVCGLWCPGRTWSRHRVQLGLPGAPQRVPLKKARCFGKWVLGSDVWAFRLPLGGPLL